MERAAAAGRSQAADAQNPDGQQPGRGRRSRSATGSSWPRPGSRVVIRNRPGGQPRSERSWWGKVPRCSGRATARPINRATRPIRRLPTLSVIQMHKTPMRRIPSGQQPGQAGGNRGGGGLQVRRGRAPVAGPQQPQQGAEVVAAGRTKSTELAISSRRTASLRMGQGRSPAASAGGNRNVNINPLQVGGGGGGIDAPSVVDPLTGGGYRNFSDTLPECAGFGERSAAAGRRHSRFRNVRAAVRLDVTRRASPPNWNVVSETIGQAAGGIASEGLGWNCSAATSRRRYWCRWIVKPVPPEYHGTSEAILRKNREW